MTEKLDFEGVARKAAAEVIALMAEDGMSVDGELIMKGPISEAEEPNCSTANLVSKDGTAIEVNLRVHGDDDIQVLFPLFVAVRLRGGKGERHFRFRYLATDGSFLNIEEDSEAALYGDPFSLMESFICPSALY